MRKWGARRTGDSELRREARTVDLAVIALCLGLGLIALVAGRAGHPIAAVVLLLIDGFAVWTTFVRTKPTW